MKSVAVIAAGGKTNDLIQVLTLLMACVHSDVKARVLFRDASVYRLSPSAINTLEMAQAYGNDTQQIEERLGRLDLLDLHKLCRDIKASGDVKYYVCSSSLAICGLKREELIPEIDEVRGLPAFLLEDVQTADQVFTF